MNCKLSDHESVQFVVLQSRHVRIFFCGELVVLSFEALFLLLWSLLGFIIGKDEFFVRHGRSKLDDTVIEFGLPLIFRVSGAIGT